MQVHMKTSPLFTVVGEGSTQKDAFKNLADNIEPFRIGACGMPNCGSKNIFPRVRVQSKFTYYEMTCADCWAKLSYGQSTENGALYPRRKYHEKHPLVKAGKAKVDDRMPNGGWEKWVKEEQQEDGEE